MYEYIFNELELLSELTDKEQDDVLPKLEFLLNEIPLHTLVYSKRMEILIKILNKCMEYDSSNKVIKTVLLRWCGHDLDSDGVLGDLAANVDCSDKLLAFLVFKFPHSTPVTILDVHIRTRYGQGMIFSYTADRIMKAYSKENLDMNSWSILIEAINETNNEIENLNSESSFWVKERLIDIQSNPLTQGNQDILDYVEEKLKAHTKKLVVKKPDWVNVCEEDKNVSFEEDSQDNTQGEYEQLKQMLENYTSKQKVEPNDFGEEAPLTTDEVIQNFISLGIGKSSNNKKMCRVYGPVNSILGVNCIGCPEGKEGPCRMFYCICREFEDEDVDNENVDEFVYEYNQSWFSGKCDVCEAKIQKLRYAVRFPVDGGGWLGCYCSFGCMRKNKARPIYENDELRIRDIQSIIKEHGIADLDVGSESPN